MFGPEVMRRPALDTIDSMGPTQVTKRSKPTALLPVGLVLVVAGVLAGCTGSDESDDKGLARDGQNEVVGGYFEDWSSTAGQVAEVRLDGEFGDDVSDDDLAQSAEAACFALASWPGDSADALLNQGVVDPQQEWLVAPHVASLETADLVYFVQSAQAVICPETADRIRLELCELSAAEIEDGVEC